MDINTFNRIQEILELSREYNHKAEASEGETKKIFETFVDELDGLYDKLLQIGQYNEQNEPEIEGIMNKTINGISAYTRITVIRKYENGMCLVFDLSPEAYLVPIDAVDVLE